MPGSQRSSGRSRLSEAKLRKKTAEKHTQGSGQLPRDTAGSKPRWGRGVRAVEAAMPSGIRGLRWSSPSLALPSLLFSP